MFLLLFLIIDLYFLIATTIAQIGKPSKGAKAEIEMHPVIIEVKIRKCLI